MHLPKLSELKERLKEVGMSARQLSIQSGISYTTVLETLNGVNENPGYLTVKKLWETIDAYDLTQRNKKPRNKAGEICSKNLITISSSSTIEQAEKKFEKHSDLRTSLPVIDNDGIPVGLVTDKSLKERMIKDPNWRKLSIRKAMEKPPMVVDYNATLKTLEAHLYEDDCVLVRQENGLEIIGIITDWDIRHRYRR